MTRSGSATRATAASNIPASPQVTWRSEHGNVLFNNQVFHIKGINWFGMDTAGASPLGLSKRSITSMLSFLASEGFNGLRLPLSVAWSLDFKHVPSNQDFTPEDADLRGRPWIDVLDKVIQESKKFGIIVMLDMHTISPDDNDTTRLWYNDRYTVCDFRSAWQGLLSKFGNNWNVFAVDIKNEVHDASWGNAEFEHMPATVCSGNNTNSPPRNGQRPTDWKQEIEAIVPELAIERQDPSGHSFVYQGLYIASGMHLGKIGTQSFPYNIPRPAYGFWSGGNLEGLKQYPLKIAESLAKQIAYSVHTYGPSVYVQDYFARLQAFTAPNALDPVYQQHDGFIEPLTDRAVIIGEWGGRNQLLNGEPEPEKNGTDDGAIMTAIATWFPEHCMADAFWWVINPESTDTGGLLEKDYQTVVGSKLKVTAQMMPKPTKVKQVGSEIQVIDPGAFNPKCVNR